MPEDHAVPYLSNLAEDASAFDIFAAYPEMYRPFAEFIETLFRGEGSMPVRQRELVFAYVSRLNECDYCYGGHSHAAYTLGIEEGLFDALMDDIDGAPVEERLKPILHYVTKLTRTPARMTPRDAQAVRDAGWPDEAFHMAIAICASANFMNRLVEGAGIAADPALFAKRGQALAERGYARPLRKVAKT